MSGEVKFCKRSVERVQPRHCQHLFPTLSAILLPHNSQGPHETHTWKFVCQHCVCQSNLLKRHNHSFGNYPFGAKPHQKS
ncbi:hypothetical protein V1264_022865 [Littorina saxatilis]|uniref:Uncharacterized protein n=1 Tax=Littorina saxatilis TaxID=31220 RepID=A0AAN9G9V2_9CAEN